MGCAPSNAKGNNPAVSTASPTKKEHKEESHKSHESHENHKSHKSHKSDKAPKVKPIVVFVLGGPGSGKGTQCEQIVKEYGFNHYSVGDLLRAEKASGSDTAKLIDEYISEGKLVPAEIPVKLLKKAMKQAGWGDHYYLIDGFPRNEENLEAWEKIFKGKADIKFTLYYECSLETMEKRILERAKTSGRSDDNPESLKKRFVTYENETKPVIEHFTSKGLIRKINAERDVSEVFADTKAALDAIKSELVKGRQTAAKEAHEKEKAAKEQAAAEQAAAEKAAEEKAAAEKAAAEQVAAEKAAAEKAAAEKAAEEQAAAEQAAKEQAAASEQIPAPTTQQADQIDTKPSAIFVLGGPGSGKGTQCERIIADFGLKHLSVGDLLRAEKTSGSALAKEIDEYMTQGKLVPSEVPVTLLKNAINAAPQGTNFLIDGFPRNKENIEVWNRLVGDVVVLKRILFYECSFETMEKRILERAKTSGRSDDNIESLKKRFDTYQSESAPVVEEYEKSGIVTKINAEREIADVYADTKKTLEAIFH